MRVTRRSFVRLAMAAGLGTALGACRGRAEVAAPPVRSGEGEPAGGMGGSAQRYREAPMLAEQVARGELPPVEERLPATPFVLEVNESIGAYGGAWRRAFDRDMAFEASPLPLDGNLAYLDRDLNLRPHIAESWEVNEEGTRLTWHLRRGMRWSNGDPVISEDLFLFWFVDQGSGEGAQSGVEKYMTMELPDDHTFIIVRPEPSYQTLPAAYVAADALRLVPSAYAKAYHPDYAPGGMAGVQAEAQAAGYADWRAYYRANVVYVASNPKPGPPTLLPWRPLTGREGGAILYERNPYYWQVDAAGQQLPYLDHVLCRAYGGEEALQARVVRAEVDCQVAGLLSQREETYRSADYAVQRYPSGEHVVLQLNPSTSDSALAGLFREREARRALSLAIDRKQFAALYDGLTVPRQFSPIEASPFYDEELSQQYLAYDPDRANRTLDESGYGQRDRDGYRMSPDGDRLRLIVQSPYEPQSIGGKVVALVLADLEAVGLECEYWVRSVDSIWASQVYGALQASVGPLSGTVMPTVSINGGFSTLGPNVWRGWGEFPEGHYVSRLDGLFVRIALHEPDLERRNALFREYLAIWKEELPVIGLLGGFQQVGIVKEGFRNVRDGLAYDEVTNHEAFQRPQQFYWERPESHVLTEQEWAVLRAPPAGPTPAEER